MTFFICIFLLLMQFLWKYIDDLVGKGLSVGVIAELMLYASASLVPLALPLTVLLSSIMTFGNLGQNNELMALKASGTSLVRIMFPLVIFIFIISVGAFFFANNAMPYTNLKMGALLHDVRKQKPEVSIKEGIFSNSLEGYSIKVSGKNKKTGMLYNLLIYDHTEKRGNVKVTVADSATMKMSANNRYMILTMYNGHSYSEVEENKRNRDEKEFPHQKDKFQEQRVLIDMSGLGFERTDENLFKNHYQMLNLSQLQYSIDSLNKIYEIKRLHFVARLKFDNYYKTVKPDFKLNTFYADSLKKYSQFQHFDSLYNSLSQSEKGKVIISATQLARNAQSFVSQTHSDLRMRDEWINKHMIEWHRKFTLAVSCFVLFFIGAPFGAIVRKGGLGMPIVISVLFFVIYYVIGISSEKSARLGATPAWQAMWMGIAVIFPIGLFLTYKAATDSVIMDIGTYLKPVKNFFQKIFKFFSKKKKQ